MRDHNEAAAPAPEANAHEKKGNETVKSPQWERHSVMHNELFQFRLSLRNAFFGDVFFLLQKGRPANMGNKLIFVESESLLIN